jgi:hypothetical protein
LIEIDLIVGEVRGRAVFAVVGAGRVAALAGAAGAVTALTDVRRATDGGGRGTAGFAVAALCPLPEGVGAEGTGFSCKWMCCADDCRRD